MKKTIVLCLLCGVLLPGLRGEEVYPQPPALAQYNHSTQIYDRGGHPLRSFLSAQETYAQTVALSDISPWLITAVLTAEDRRFYQHRGIDGRAVLRAAWQNVRSGSILSGASTITQQLARALHPRPKNWRGKWAEARDALQLERRYSKDEILQQYLNTAQFGNQTQGVEAAAQFYFGVSAAQLSVAQSALLAALLQGPARLNPLQRPAQVLARRNWIVGEMFRAGNISQEQYELALKEPLGVTRGERPFSAPHFSRLIYKLAPDAQQIYSTLDKDLQLYAQKTVRAHLAQLTEQHVTNGAVLVLDNRSGEILAYVGSADFYDERHAGQVDGIQARRQPGSALKPFVYALALQNGLTAASILDDEDTFFEGGFRPRNYDETFHGKVSLRRALANSYNVPVIKAAEPLGAARILAFLHELGFYSLTKSAEFYGLGIALGGGEVTLLELAQAYAALARGGRLQPVAAATQPPLLLTQKTARVLPEEIAYIITDILSDNAARADAFGLNSPLAFPFPAAAKTGTSKDYKDNFAIAYTPRLTVAVWVGNFDSSPMQKVSGVTGAAPIMHDVLLYANEKYPGGEFVRPAGVSAAQICTRSGLLAGASCPQTREEIFVEGTLPQQTDNGPISSQQTLQITFPVRGDVFVYDPALPAAGQALHMRTAYAQGPCKWKLNGEKLPQSGADFWWPLQKGTFDLSVTCGGQTARTFFTVL